MPSGDRTGPLGQGSMTGRRFGFCAGNETPGYESGAEFSGRRWRLRYGTGGEYRNGLGRRNRWRWPFSGSGAFYHRIPGREEEIGMLKSEATALKNAQKSIEKRLGELENGG